MIVAFFFYGGFQSMGVRGTQLGIPHDYGTSFPQAAELQLWHEISEESSRQLQGVQQEAKMSGVHPAKNGGLTGFMNNED